MQMYGVESGVEATLHQTQLPIGAELRKIYVDTSKPLDASFEKYGHIFYNVLVQDGKGRWTTTSRLKYWEQDGTFRKILPINTPVYPFEPMMDDLEEVIKKEIEIDEGAEGRSVFDEAVKKARFEIKNKYFSHNGFSMYVELVSPDIRKVIKGSYVKDDIVQLGLVIRNGIQTGVSLGADFFTYRLHCLNGAVGRGENFGSISVRHVGEQKKMIDVFKQGIPVIINLGQRILDVYEMSTAFRFNEEMAKKIYKRTHITEKYFPQYFAIDKDQKDPEKQVSLTNEARGLSLWEVFNDMTAALTRSLETPDTKMDKRGKVKNVMHLGFSGFSHQTRQLHKVLVDIVGSGKAESA
jgi:hypothetical protein